VVIALHNGKKGGELKRKNIYAPTRFPLPKKEENPERPCPSFIVGNEPQRGGKS